MCNFKSKEIYKSRGTYYGYPECCVNFFCDHKDELDDINKGRSKELGILYGLFMTMFCVPCPKCYAVLLRKKKETLEDVTIKDKCAKVRKKR